jgi:hypothetical protein
VIWGFEDDLNLASNAQLAVSFVGNETLCQTRERHRLPLSAEVSQRDARSLGAASGMIAGNLIWSLGEYRNRHGQLEQNYQDVTELVCLPFSPGGQLA